MVILDTGGSIILKWVSEKEVIIVTGSKLVHDRVQR